MKNAPFPTYTIAPIDKDLLKSELTRELYVRSTNKSDNEVYIINHHNAPNVMLEIGRLREVSFAMSGGGTGKPVDIDEFDTSENCYEQLIVWDPEEEEIVGGYRFKDCSTICHLDPLPLSTHHYFTFTEEFMKDYLPKTIELGRSWVQPNFQPSVDSRKGLFSLDNLWDGLGAIVVNHPHIDYYFGKITMYTNFDPLARDAVLSFMHHYFPAKKMLVKPKNALEIKHDMSAFTHSLKDLDFKEGMRELMAFVKERDENIPPLFNNYMQLSPTLQTFGTVLNNDFGAVEETGILLTIADIYEEKRERYVDTYITK